MSELPPPVSSEGGLPPSIARVLGRFAALSREEKMAALVSYAKKLEPLPERFRSLPNDEFEVPECQTPLRIFPELSQDRLHFYADIDTRQSPTVAAFLSILFAAVNDHPPETTLALPNEFVRTVMRSVGLGSREVGLEAIIARVKRHARDAARPSA